VLAARDALVQALDETTRRLEEVRGVLARADAEAIAGWNERAAEDRRRLLEAQLAGGPVHELRVSVPNRPGVVAQIALELGRAGINIADMALHPAADMREGVVALWIAGDDDAARAQELAGAPGDTFDLTLTAFAAGQDAAARGRAERVLAASGDAARLAHR
jgi:prephenate dehydrogenase